MADQNPCPEHGLVPAVLMTDSDREQLRMLADQLSLSAEPTELIAIAHRRLDALLERILSRSQNVRKPDGA